MIIYFVPPPSQFAVFRERLSGPCSHCWRFGLQEKIENLDVAAEAGNMVVDEVGSLTYNGFFIRRRDGASSEMVSTCGECLRHKREGTKI